MTLVAGTTTLAWLLFVADPAASYLFPNNILPALRQTGSLLLGETAPRQLYASGGYASPAWETVAGFAAVGVLLLTLPVALYSSLGPSGLRPPMAVAIGVAIAFPLSLMPRLAPDGVAISGRSSAYVFAGLGCAVGLLAAGATWRRHRRGRTRAAPPALPWLGTAGARHATAVATGLVTVVFIGEVTIGTAFYQRLPEPPNSQGYPWSVQPDVISASKWAREQLGHRPAFRREPA